MSDDIPDLPTLLELFHDEVRYKTLYHDSTIVFSNSEFAQRLHGLPALHRRRVGVYARRRKAETSDNINSRRATS